jgi:hypothetical protein
MTHCEKWRGLAGTRSPDFGDCRNENRMLNELMLILSATIVISMVKKPTKPLFGQLTLTGELALDWIKKDKINEIIAAKIWFCNISALVNDWNTQPWMLDKGIVALIFPTSEWGNPLFISQKSILKVLESRCVEWEEEGAKVSLLGKKLEGQITCIEFPENPPTFKIYREKGYKDFDPYIVEIEL